LVNWDAYVARKEAEAGAVRLEPWTTAVDTHDARAKAVGNAWSRALFDGDFYISPSVSADLPSTSLVFVQSRDGNTGARNPSALGGGETDKHLVYEGLSRVAADAVMAGAETIRDGTIVFSVWHPELVRLRASLGLPRHPMQVVATLGQLDLSSGLLFNTAELRVVIVTIAACGDALRRAIAERPWIETVVMDQRSDLPDALAALRRRGVRTLSCVGGRTLAGQLLDAHLVRDLYLTTSAQEGGEPNTPLYRTPIDGAVQVRKRGTGADAGITFEHLAI
jgi:riboflavin biosynthesis pyrimidine reductase